jgi:hypothetical protein
MINSDMLAQRGRYFDSIVIGNGFYPLLRPLMEEILDFAMDGCDQVLTQSLEPLLEWLNLGRRWRGSKRSRVEYGSNSDISE